MAIGIVAGLQSSNNDLELTLSKNFIWLDKNQTTTVTVDTPSDGKIYAFSSNPNIIIVTVNNKTITINCFHYGTAIITVGQDVGTGNYANKIPKNKQIFFTNIEPILENNSWEAISEISQKGTGNQYWSIGDTKSIILNGTIGTLTLSNFETNVFILHFNYSMNGIADNNIIWGGFKDNNGKDIALIDSNYENTSNNGTMYFNMNHWGDNIYYGSNHGGWKGSCLRYDILGATSTAPSQYGAIYTSTNVGYDATSATLTSPKANTLLAALPVNFRSSLRLWSRWIDAVGNSSNVAANIKETIDAVTLLTEFEVYGTRQNANQYEQNYQFKMEYYRLGNSRIKYQHNDSFYSACWWLASPRHDRSISFCNVYSLGSYYTQYANTSQAIAPAFKT